MEAVEQNLEEHAVKLTQAQRAEMFAQLLVAKATAALSVKDKVLDAKELLEAYEAELATWPDPEPAKYGPVASTMAEGFRSEDPVPLTGDQAKTLRNLPDQLDLLPENKRRALGLETHVRNPERIDFNAYPIPPGYTVASDADCMRGVQDDWMVYSEELGWMSFDSPITSRTAHNWTYLRPLREGEK